MKILFLMALFLSTVAHATDTPNLTLKVYTSTTTIQFDECYSFVQVDTLTGIIAAFCTNMHTIEKQNILTRWSNQRWQFNANWSDVRGFESSVCYLLNDRQYLGNRVVELTCKSIQYYDPNDCGIYPCPIMLD